jgi:hypothetical protein
VEVEEKKCNNLKDICDKQLEYFKQRNQMINVTQQGLVRALEGLTIVLGDLVRNRASRREGIVPADVEMRPPEYPGNASHFRSAVGDQTNHIHTSSGVRNDSSDEDVGSKSNFL